MSDSVATKWAVYEANVQQYRVLSATVQSFLLAVGSIWFSSASGTQNLSKAQVILLVILFLIGQLHIFYVWIPVVLARIRIVDYYKGQLDLSQELRDEIKSQCTEDQYRSSKEIRLEIAKRYFEHSLQKPIRKTRFKLDIVVPILYSIIWVAIAAAPLVK